MMGSQSIAEQADNLLSIIGDNKTYAAKIKEMKELAQAITAEKDRLAKAQAEYSESVTQVSNDRAAIERASAKATADLKEAQTLRTQAQEKFETTQKMISSKGAQLDQQAAEQIARANALDVLAGQIEARQVALDLREQELEQREADVLTASKEMSDRLARLKSAVG
jgi:chromosome segregation ATPase